MRKIASRSFFLLGAIILLGCKPNYPLNSHLNLDSCYQDEKLRSFLRCLLRGDFEKAEDYYGVIKNIDESGRYDVTPLEYLIRKDCVDGVEYLLRKGADPNILFKNDEYSPLTTACVFSSAEIVEILLNAGADPDLKTHSDDTSSALLASALFYRDSFEKIVLLVEAGCDVNQISNNGEVNAAMLAAMVRKWEIVEYLITNGIDVFFVNIYGIGLTHYTLLGANISEGEIDRRIDVLKLLFQKGVDVFVGYNAMSDQDKLNALNPYRYKERIEGTGGVNIPDSD